MLNSRGGGDRTVAKKHDTVWDLKPHTRIKHEILKGYLTRWMPILGKRNKRIMYIDGFAGPGIYKGGEDGSPIIALDTITERTESDYKVWALLIEKEKKRFKMLQDTINSRFGSNPKDTYIKIFGDDYEHVIMSHLNKIEDQNDVMVPTFAFLDPFGYSDIPMALIKKLLSYDRCEILITFMNQSLGRFYEPDKKNVKKVFGSEDCLNPSHKKLGEASYDFVLRRYMYKIRKYVSEIRKNEEVFTKSFEMIDNNNRVIYNLIFVTTHWRGLEEMKEVMLKVGDSRSYSFSNRIESGQTFITSEDVDNSWLETAGNRVFYEFAGKRTKIIDIHKFIVKDTEYRYQRSILSQMRKNHSERIVSVTDSEGKSTKSFKDDNIIEFSTIQTRKVDLRTHFEY